MQATPRRHTHCPTEAEQDSQSQPTAKVIDSIAELAPRELVWRALTEPQLLVQWFGSKGFTNPVCEVDVRPG